MAQGSIPDWTPESIRQRIHNIMVGNRCALTGTEIARTMSSCEKERINSQLDHMMRKGIVRRVGDLNHYRYTLTIEAQFSEFSAKLWRREPTFTEPREHFGCMR